MPRSGVQVSPSPLLLLELLLLFCGDVGARLVRLGLAGVDGGGRLAVLRLRPAARREAAGRAGDAVRLGLDGLLVVVPRRVGDADAVLAEALEDAQPDGVLGGPLLH